MKISAKIITHSISPDNVELITYEIVLPKVLLAEFNTHRMLSKNLSSSRAIPTKAFIEVDSFEPLYYGKNQAGMVAADERLVDEDLQHAQQTWKFAIDECKNASSYLATLGLHKQWANRPNDWHTMARGIASGTEWDNFFYLRNHDDAQPEIHELARLMLEAKNASTPFMLHPGEWHLPYIELFKYKETKELGYFTDKDGAPNILTLEDAKKISVSCCAQVSYRKQDDSLEKAERVYAMLNIGSTTKPNHSSPLEHLATPMRLLRGKTGAWEDGVTHMDRRGILWSANFQGWVQYRKLIEAL